MNLWIIFVFVYQLGFIDMNLLGGWSQWGKWSECSAEYGIGRRIRCRTCDSPIPTNPKLGCKGFNCTTEPCQGPHFKEPKRGVWGLWSPWSKCTVTCGQGLKKRNRFCVKEIDLITPFYIESTTAMCPLWWGSKLHGMSLIKRNVEVHSFCTGPYSEIEPCYLSSCAVDGEWSEWQPWSQCSKACGIGVQSGSRACSSPPPSNGGANCSGPYSRFRHCYLEPCQESDHEVATFSGDGVLYYRKTAHVTRTLHLYVKLKPFSSNGDILLRTSTSSHTELRNKVRLSLAAGYIVFTASLGHCHLAVISHHTVKVELVVKTASQDGFLMLLKDIYGTKFLILSIEPGRVLLQLVMNDCVHKSFQMLEEKTVLESNGINLRSITGILSHVKVNNKIMDISSLPTIIERGSTPFTSESTSNTDYYDETELIYGEPMNLICYHDMQSDKEKNIFSSIFGNINIPLWIKLDTPITPNETKLTDQE